MEKGRKVNFEIGTAGKQQIIDGIELIDTQYRFVYPKDKCQVERSMESIIMSRFPMILSKVKGKEREFVYFLEELRGCLRKHLDIAKEDDQIEFRFRKDDLGFCFDDVKEFIQKFAREYASMHMIEDPLFPGVIKICTYFRD